MTTPTLAPEAPAYITINDAANALATKPWPVVQLVRDGKLRAVKFGPLTLVSAYDVDQLEQIFAVKADASEIPQQRLEELVDAATGKGVGGLA